MWIFKFDGEQIKVGYYKPDGRAHFPLTFEEGEIKDALRMVHYLNGGDGAEIDLDINEGW